jgi:two-component system cell cycle sensor histidine kinase/response regulator CckA
LERKEAGLPETTKLLLHELRVHQIELEMQNEELRGAQVELDVSRARYFDLYDLAPVGYVTVGENGLIQQSNLTIATLLGVTRADLSQRPLSRFIQKEDADGFYLLRKKLLATGKAQSSELRLVKHDGATIWAHLEATAAEDAGEPVIRIVLSDVTVRKQAEHERERLEIKMQEAQKLESLGVLAGGIAHDFNNLIAVILGNIDLAKRTLPPGSPVLAYLEPIKEAALRAADLCTQMLSYSGQGRFVIQRLNLSEVVQTTAQLLKISISNRVDLQFHLAPDLPPVKADTTQLQQVIMNLVINASEAIGDKQGTINLTTGFTRLDRAEPPGAEPTSEPLAGAFVWLEVSDTGSGMNKETQKKIFDPFYTTKFTGRGLGLAAVLGIVRGHKGTIRVKSEPNLGTTFKLQFPIASVDPESTPTPQPAPARSQGRGTVLVVDDELTIREFVAEMLTVDGFEPVLAADGSEALEIFRADPDRFTLVLLDLTMPKMGGAETFPELRKLRSDIRIVLMSGYDQQESLKHFPSGTPAGFLPKPFSIDQLHAVVQSVLG